MALKGWNDFENAFAAFMNVRAVYKANENKLLMATKALIKGNPNNGFTMSLNKGVSELYQVMSTIERDIQELKAKKEMFSEEAPLSGREEMVEALREVWRKGSIGITESVAEAKVGPHDATSKETSEELCRKIGADPKKHWGTVENYLLDAYFQGQQSVKKG